MINIISYIVPFEMSFRWATFRTVRFFILFQVKYNLILIFIICEKGDVIHSFRLMCQINFSRTYSRTIYPNSLLDSWNTNLGYVMPTTHSYKGFGRNQEQNLVERYLLLNSIPRLFLKIALFFQTRCQKVSCFDSI